MTQDLCQKVRSKGPEKQLGSYKHSLLFQRIWVRIPAPTRWVATIYNSSPMGSDALFGVQTYVTTTHLFM